MADSHEPHEYPGQLKENPGGSIPLFLKLTYVGFTIFGLAYWFLYRPATGRPSSSSSTSPPDMLPEARWIRPPAGARLHRARRAIQIVTSLLLIVAPFVDLLRFDVKNGALILFGTSFGLGELGVAYAILVLSFVVVFAGALLYGRIYCGWMCPQTTLSELVATLERWALPEARAARPGVPRRLHPDHPGQRRLRGRQPGELLPRSGRPARPGAGGLGLLRRRLRGAGGRPALAAPPLLRRRLPLRDPAERHPGPTARSACSSTRPGAASAPTACSACAPASWAWTSAPSGLRPALPQLRRLHRGHPARQALPRAAAHLLPLRDRDLLDLAVLAPQGGHPRLPPGGGGGAGPGRDHAGHRHVGGPDRPGAGAGGPVRADHRRSPTAWSAITTSSR